ncbi:hypothetical protein CRENBAI_003800 [Crenichthys baileyi]|uniref:Uncharacterized protein n=1 Tax=Crenichthys baileyi TaxID=28760 RepID=A0AAV9SM24_9TELE
MTKDRMNGCEIERYLNFLTPPPSLSQGLFLTHSHYSGFAGATHVYSGSSQTVPFATSRCRISGCVFLLPWMSSSSEGSWHREGSTASSQLFSPELVIGHPAPSAGHQLPVRLPVSTWVQASLDVMQAEYMKTRCCSFVLYLMEHPEDLNLVHTVLQAEFIAEGWLDTPAPVSAGGPFEPLFIAIKAAQSPKDPGPQPVATKLHEPQHTAKLYEPQPLVPEFPEGSEDGPPQARVPEFREGFEDKPSLSS